MQSMKLHINLDEFEKWLTPKKLKNVLESVGYEVELKEKYEHLNENEPNSPLDVKLKKEKGEVNE